MNNHVPDEWDSKSLIECSSDGISNGVFCDPKNIGSGYKLINVYEMYQGYGVDVNLTRRLRLTEKEFLNNKVKYGDVFFTRSSLKMEGIAYCNINLSHDDDITYDGHLMKITPNLELVNAEYLARFCLSDSARTYFMSTAKHSTMTTIAQADIAPLQVLLPPLPEQQKIATILTSVDEVIEKTQAQIDKLKDLKTGMMQELLTKGIGHTEFKDSPVGRIPVGWEVKTLKELTFQIRDGNYGADYPKASEMLDSGIPFLTSTVVGNDQKVNLAKLKYISEKKHVLLAKAHIKPDDILFTNRGANVGNVAIVPEILDDANIGPQLTFIRVDTTITSPLFLYIALQSDYFKDQLMKLDSGSAMNFFGIGTTEKFIFAIPSLNEQAKLADAINAVLTKLDSLNIKLKQTSLVKKALMQDLLTGKVRVNTAQTTTEVAVG